MLQIKRTLRDTLNDDVELPPRDPFCLCGCLAPAAVEQRQFVALPGAKRRRGVMGLFGREEIEALFQVRAVEARWGHGRDYHRRR